MKLSREKQKHIVGILVATLAICLVLWQVLVVTASSRIKTYSTRLVEARTRLSTAQSWVEKSDEIEVEMQTKTGLVQEREKQMASPVDPYAWGYELLNQASEGHNVEVIDVTRPRVGPGRFIPDFPYQEAVFTIRGRAYYHDFGKFVAEFENNYPHFRIENLTLSVTPESGVDQMAAGKKDEEKLNFRLDLVVLVKPSS